MNNLKYILLEVTDDCNFECKHCRVEGWSKITNKLSTSEILNLIKQASKMNVNTITFSGGEPLLRNDILNLIKCCKKNKIRSKLQTNSFLFNEKLGKQLKKAGLNIFGTGIDGCSSKTHDALRNMPNAFKKVKKAIKIAKKLGFEIHTETTITKLNQNEVNKIIMLAEKIGVNYFFIRSIVVAGCAEKNLIIDKNEYKKVLEKVYELKYKLKKIKITSQDPLFHLIDKKLLNRLEKKYGNIRNKKFRGGCSAGLNSLNIKSDGEVKLCSFLPTNLGNIRKQSLFNIWIKKEKIIKNIIQRNLTGFCDKCEDKWICGGCRARSLIINNNLFKTDPYCWKVIQNEK